MAEDLHLDERRLAFARSELIRACNELREAGSRVPGVEMQSLTGISGEVREYLEAVRMASRLLAESAGAAGEVLGSAIQMSTDTDRSVAAALNRGLEETQVMPGSGQART
ncbi:MAG: hypothetical protein D3X82_08915 [Candidatus Leucobacter sulfamidivorax]|nr:hypothetical protein [Candidatus Leucobacter sulfamidivorax]